MSTTEILPTNQFEFYEDHDKDDDKDDDSDDNPDDLDDDDDYLDDQGKQWHGMDRAISFCTHTMHTDERPTIPTWTMTRSYTNLDLDDVDDSRGRLDAPQKVIMPQVKKSMTQLTW